LFTTKHRRRRKSNENEMAMKEGNVGRRQGAALSPNLSTAMQTALEGSSRLIPVQELPRRLHQPPIRSRAHCGLGSCWAGSPQSRVSNGTTLNFSAKGGQDLDSQFAACQTTIANITVPAPHLSCREHSTSICHLNSI